MASKRKTWVSFLSLSCLRLPCAAQDLSWNYLRLNSAVEIGKAVRYNQTLTYLNLEYNGFGTQGAEELGTSLVLSLSKDTKSSVAVRNSKGSIHLYFER